MSADMAANPRRRSETGGLEPARREGELMGTVVMHNVASVDGYIADEADDVGPLFEWYSNGDTPLGAGGAMVSRVSAEYVQPAVAKAKELAGDRNVAVAAGDVGGQALALGLVDEVAMDVVPVVFVSGKRYFGSVDRQYLLEDPRRGHPRRPGAAPALPGPPLTGGSDCTASAIDKRHPTYRKLY
jgi:hypothetical protein